MSIKSKKMRTVITFGIVTGVLVVSAAFGPKVYNFAKEKLPETEIVKEQVVTGKGKIAPDLPIQNSDMRVCTDFLQKIKDVNNKVDEQVANFNEGSVDLENIEVEMYVLMDELMMIPIPEHGEELHAIIEDKIETVRDYTDEDLEEAVAEEDEEEKIEILSEDGKVMELGSAFDEKIDHAMMKMLGLYKIPYTQTEYGVGYKKVTY